MIAGWGKVALIFGAGVATGVVGAAILSRNSSAARKGAAAVLSRGYDLKEKAKKIIGTAKENIEDIAAEARSESAKRQGSKA